MKALCIIFVSLFIFPCVALGANFAKQSIFLSTSAPIEGETVVIHAIVANDSNTKFRGTLKVHEGDDSIGSVAVALDAQGAYVASVSWKPSAGKHTITGTLEETDGTLVAKESETFDVAAKKDAPAAGDTSTSTVESSQKIQKQIQGFSPAVANATTPIFNAVDSLRQGAAGALTKGEQWSKEKAQKKEPKGSVLGASTRIGAAGLSYIFNILLYLVKNAALFYPILAIAFLYGLWRLYKRMRKPSFR